jgi:glycosyltransferase involved in cell wall biosynthesis
VAARELKVLYALDWFPDPQTGGTEMQFWRMLSAFDRKVVSSQIVMLRPSKWLEERLPAGNVETLNVLSLRDPRNLLRIIGSVLRARLRGVRIVHTFFNDSSIIFPVFCKLLGLKVVLSRRDLGFWYTQGSLRVMRFNRFFVDRVICNSEAVRQVVINEERYAPKRVGVITNASGGRSYHGSMAEARAAIGLAPDAAVISVVANLRPIKRLHDLVEAFAQVYKTMPNARLLLVGDDKSPLHAPYAGQLREQAARLGVADAVIFMGRLDDAGMPICASDVCVLPSESEGLANVLIEYGLYAKPTVCSRAGGNPEVVADGQTGIVFPIGDVPALTAALDRLLKDPALAHRMGLAARQRVETEFSVEKCIRSYVGLYHDLAA